MRRTPNPDANLARTLERLVSPQPDDAFRDGLLWRVRANERMLLRRWRRATIVLAVVAAASLSGAGVLAAKTVFSGESTVTRVLDRTYSCVARPQGRVPLVGIGTSVSLPPTQGTEREAAFTMASVTDTSPGDNDPAYLEFTAKADSFKVDPTGCKASKARVPFTSKGLVSNGVLTPSFVGGFRAFCKVSTGRVDVHLRLTLADGAPVKALIAVRAQKGGKPVAYLDWAPKRQATFLSSRCAT